MKVAKLSMRILQRHTSTKIHLWIAAFLDSLESLSAYSLTSCSLKWWLGAKVLQIKKIGVISKKTMNYLYQMTHREKTSCDGWDMKHILERIFYVELIEKKSNMLNRRTVTFTNYQVI